MAKEKKSNREEGGEEAKGKEEEGSEININLLCVCIHVHTIEAHIRR